MKRQIKLKALIAGFGLLCMSGLVSASDCYSQVKEDDSNTHLVYNSDNVYLGYTAKEDDDTWFVWIDQKGASNETPATLENAVQKICGDVTED